MPKILVVDDEKVLVKGIKFNLENEGYQVEVGYDGEQAVELARNGGFDLIILDLMMPKIDGLQACMRIREFSNVPLVMLTAKSEDADKLMGFECGADDYVTKPFGTAELLARIRIALRHVSNGTPDTPTGKAQNGRLTIDYDKRRIYLDDQEVHLTQVEYKIVMLTMLHIGKVLTYDFIIRCVWGARPTVNNQILRVNMANIRRKLEANPADPQFIITETGVGYSRNGHAEDIV